MDKQKVKPSIATKHDKYVVCPHCVNELLGLPEIGQPYLDDYGRTLRLILGWCVHCNFGFDMQQYKPDPAGQRWLIHRYRIRRLSDDGMYIIGAWVEVNPLPESTALLLTGPGGQHRQAITQEELDGAILMAGMIEEIKAVVRKFVPALKRSARRG